MHTWLSHVRRVKILIMHHLIEKPLRFTLNPKEKRFAQYGSEGVAVIYLRFNRLRF